MLEALPEAQQPLPWLQAQGRHKRPPTCLLAACHLRATQTGDPGAAVRGGASVGTGELGERVSMLGGCGRCHGEPTRALRNTPELKGKQEGGGSESDNLYGLLTLLQLGFFGKK